MILEEIIHQQFPALWNRLEGFDVKILSITFSWLVHMYINVFPFSTVVRIWDVILVEGDKVLLKIAIALIAKNEKNLLAIEDDSELANAFKFVFFRSMTFRKLGVLQFDVDELFKLTFEPKTFLKGESPLFPYSRNELQEVRRNKRLELEGKSVMELTELIQPSSNVCIIDSDDEV